MLLAALYFPCRCLRRPPSRSLLLTSLVITPGPLVGPERPTCNYPFPIPIVLGTLHIRFSKIHTIIALLVYYGYELWRRPKGNCCECGFVDGMEGTCLAHVHEGGRRWARMTGRDIASFRR
jgi:hypothetical protein